MKSQHYIKEVDIPAYFSGVLGKRLQTQAAEIVWGPWGVSQRIIGVLWQRSPRRWGAKMFNADLKSNRFESRERALHWVIKNYKTS